MEPCERFTVLDWRPDENITKCDVCDHLEGAHENPGRRRLSGGEIEALRRSLIVAMYERQEEAPQSGPADEAGDVASHPPGSNSEPHAVDPEG